MKVHVYQIVSTTSQICVTIAFSGRFNSYRFTFLIGGFCFFSNSSSLLSSLLLLLSYIISRAVFLAYIEKRKVIICRCIKSLVATLSRTPCKGRERLQQWSRVFVVSVQT